MKLYNSLTAGHGSGAAELYRGEVCCAQGRFADAEIYGYQALYASLQRKNACARCKEGIAAKVLNFL